MLSRLLRTLIPLAFIISAIPAYAQQTGVITGKVVDSGGGVLPGVTVEARANVLPVPRVTTTGANGEYRLPALPPGAYTITFVLSGMQNVTRQAEVQLSQDTLVDATLGLGGVTETVEVTATASLIEKDTATIKSGLSNAQIMSLPVGQEYRDLLKLIPGVQYSQDSVRGPSAGGSGQDNVYQFDGVNVTLPLFGTLSAEPSSHDIAQVTTIRAGAQAVDFDRSGGFSIDTISKSGTNRYAGEISYQFQNDNMTAALDSGSASRYEQDRSWLVASIGGPVLPNRLFFYGSYYRPENSRENRANRYGELPPYQRTRNEGFGKVTFTPVSSVLLNFSYRGSERKDTSALFASNASSTTGTGSEAWQKIGIAEGSWVINSRSLLTFRYNHFLDKSQGRPDNVANVNISTAVGTRLDTSTLDTQGLLTVPVLVAGQAAYNAFVQPLIDRYGYIENGVRIGGGTVGYGSRIRRRRVPTGRRAGGLQHLLRERDWARAAPRLSAVRRRGGPGPKLERLGFDLCPWRADEPRWHADFLHRPDPAADGWCGGSDPIRVSLDQFRGQRHDPVEGLVVQPRRAREPRHALRPGSPGGQLDAFRVRARARQQVQNVQIPFSKMIQPRIGATWAYNGNDTVYGSYARYNPAASSLPRAASWDRNLIGTFIDNHFDANGVLFAAVPVNSSSGKLFVDDLTPRTIDEYLLGTARQFGRRLTARAYWRYRDAGHFWEDTNNNARIAFNPPADIPRELYVPDLAAKLAQITNGSTYVIAELDGAYTKYYDFTAESEWRGDRAFVRGSYTWSHYYGNFDQDNSTTANDANVFIGSSFIGDGAGRQLWDNKDGDLRGDRRHMLKLYGYYNFKWNATAGTFFVAQSGQPWEAWSYEPYIGLTTSTSDVNRYAEPAGSRTSDAHWQMDLKYIQNVRLGGHLNLQLDADLFNVFDNQTGYNFQSAMHSSDFNTARSFYDPRRFQLAARLQF